MTVKVRSIVALSRNGVIGKENTLPWPKFKSDMKFFKDTTMGNPIIMGANTWKSLGKALPGRVNIVVSRTLRLETDENLRTFSTYADALAFAKRVSETGYVYVIGGKQLYETADRHGVDEYFITQIDEDYEGDTSYEPPVYNEGYDLIMEWIEKENNVRLITKHYKKRGV